MKNKCLNCKYLKRPWGLEPDLDWFCACGLDYEKYIGEDDSGGCYYSEDMLELLSEWQDLCETLSWYSLDFYSEFEKLKRLEERLENKKLNNEEITLQEEIETENARKDYRKLCYMAEDHIRCEYLRFFEKKDQNRKLRKYLKKQKQYPYWIHDLFSDNRGGKDERE